MNVGNDNLSKSSKRGMSRLKRKGAKAQGRKGIQGNFLTPLRLCAFALNDVSPMERTEFFGASSFQPSLRDLRHFAVQPGVETPVYYRSSLWDAARARN
jgi:hypothetical protein